MNLLEKINWLKEERYVDLDSWEKGFIDDLYETIQQHPDEPTEDEVLEFFTRRQIEKVDEIWENLGL